MFGAYDRGYDDGEKKGFNDAIDAAKKLIAQRLEVNDLGSLLSKALADQLEELKKK